MLLTSQGNMKEFFMRKKRTSSWLRFTSNQSEHKTRVIMIYQNMLIMFKKRLCLRRFVANFMNFCVMTAFEIFCESFFKVLDDCFQTFLLLNQLFVSVIKIINLTILKLTKISFLMKYCTTYKVPASLCIQSE